MAKSWSVCYWHLCLACGLAMGGASAIFGDCAHAQITPDTTLGAESSVVTPTAPGSQIDVISGGAKRDTNLFHSFEQFSIPTGGTAYFNNASDIHNIISRVTGKSVSNIDGLIRANASANLFLINPNGIIFGSHAWLNIGGSFLASTASSLNFADGSSFSATAVQAKPLLTVSIPLGLQFGQNLGSILNQSVVADSSSGISIPVGLQVKPGKTLALVGGDVALEGSNLTAYAGRIELGSVAGPSLVSLTPTAQGWALGYEGVQKFRDIQLSQAATVDASGEGGGNVQVQGRRIKLTEGSQIVAFTGGSLSGGTLTVNASDSVELIGSVTTADGQDFSSLRTDTDGSGSAGDLKITTRRLIVQDGAFVSVATSDSGRGGTLALTAEDSVELRGTSADGQFPSSLLALTRDTGPAGNLMIVTGRLIVQNGARVIAGAATDSQGKGGNLAVTADSVELSGTAPNSQYPSGLFARTRGTGPAGNLTIATGQLIVRDKAQVTVSGVESGDAGTLKVKAREIRLDNEAAIVAETASGEGGNITLLPQNLLLLRRGSEISTTAGAGGNGGNITIKTPLLVAVPEENSDITANANSGAGGFIQITAQGIFGLKRRSVLTRLSDITAFSQQNPDLNGVVEINTPDLDPSSGLVTLSAQPVDITGLIAQGCPAGGGNRGRGGSKFIVTGRGGLPPNPTEALRSDPAIADLGTPVQGEENSVSATISSNPTSSEPAPIVEAQGWIIGANGSVVLTASAPTITPHIPWMTPASCHAPKTSS